MYILGVCFIYINCTQHCLTPRTRSLLKICRNSQLKLSHLTVLQNKISPSRFLPNPAPPQPEVAVAPLRLPDMRTVMQRTGGPDYEDMIREIDDHMGPDKHLDVPSERCGGGVRRIQLKRKATEMSRSLSEIFAYLTSTTASTEDAAAVLQSFGNVGLAFCSCLLTCRMIFCICCIHCIYSINLLIMSYKCMYACAYGV